MRVPSFSLADYTQALLAMLPRGIIWQRDPASVQGTVLQGTAQTLIDTTNRAGDLLVDAFPSSTAELLPEWELSLGLPDPCVGELPTVKQRVQAVVSKFLADGGASVAYFVALAASLGLTVTITEFAAMRAGIMEAGDMVVGDDYAYHWQVNVAASQLTYYFEAGAASAGDALETFGSTNGIECIFGRIKPAQTTVSFVYS